MKATVDKDGLLAAVQAAATALPGKSLKPTLDCIRLEAAGGVLRLTATDCEVGVRADAGAAVDAEGVTLADGKKLMAATREAGHGLLCLEAAGSKLALSGPGGYRVLLPTHDAAAFPSWPGQDPAEPHRRIGQADLAGMLAGVRHAAAADQGRYVMAGVFLYLDAKDAGAGCRAVASDGRRIAWIDGPACGGPQDAPAAEGLLPLKAVSALARLLDASGEDEATVFLRKNECIVSGPGWECYTLLVEGRFPDWRLVIPKPGAIATRASVASAAGLLSCVRQAAVMADDTSKVSLLFAEALAITGGGDDAPSRSECPLESMSGPACRVHLNAKYLADALRAMPGGYPVEVHLPAAPKPKTDDEGDEQPPLAKPVLLRCGPAFQAVLMPLC